jgi:hypothetical protein
VVKVVVGKAAVARAVDKAVARVAVNAGIVVSESLMRAALSRRS